MRKVATNLFVGICWVQVHLRPSILWLSADVTAEKGQSFERNFIAAEESQAHQEERCLHFAASDFVTQIAFVLLNPGLVEPFRQFTKPDPAAHHVDANNRHHGASRNDLNLWVNFYSSGHCLP